MSLLSSSLVLSAVMLLGCLLPVVSDWARRHARICLLFGTGALLGLCVFAILPEIVETGGLHTLWLVAIAGAVYSWFHLYHVHHHHDSHDHHHHARHEECAEDKVAIGVLLASMSLHCLADGVVLAVSFDVSAQMAHAVFLWILAHKFYEAFNVSIALREKARDGRHFARLIAIYASAFPLGVVLGRLVPVGFDKVPVIVMSIAVGGLLGCLWHDFLVPSLQQLKQRRAEVGWLLLGFLLSSLLRGGI